MSNEWLKSEHPIYTLRKAEWERNERRFGGGPDVLQEVRRFDWEVGGPPAMQADRTREHEQQLAMEAKLNAGSPATHYGARQSEATYLNFPESFASMLIGHLMRQAPQADQALKFGRLGTVKRADDVNVPSRAELLYYNADGVGNDGSQWDNYWTLVSKWSVATGHRWILAEAPAVKPNTLQDEIDGRRPYLISYSPLDVPNWHEEGGELLFAIVRFWYRTPKVDGAELAGNIWKEGRRLFVRKGFADLGPTYLGGGWWDYDADGNEIAGRTGTWDASGGRIPFWKHFYERHPKRLSRSGIFEMGQAAIAYMNTDSAAGYDFWDACSSLVYLMGIDKDGFNLVADKLGEGAKLLPVLMNEMSKTVPQVYDGSQGAVTAEVANKRLLTIREAVREIASLEVSGGPDASGLAKQLGFLDAKSPRLRLLASELESSQNTAIHFLEKRWGFPQPTGSVKWPRDFDLAPLLESIDRYLESQLKAGASSATITTRALMAAAGEAGLIADGDDSKKLEAEFATSITAKAAREAQERDVLGDFLPGGGKSDAPDAQQTPPADETGADQKLQTTTATVLNGAQIASAKDIVIAVVAGQLPRDTGVQMLQAFFNLTPEKAEQIMGSAGTPTPTTPNPNPADDGAPAGEPAAAGGA